MLLNLHIKNYALIEDLNLEFREGLNIFTGETGAGKSIIIESLGLILGERASAQAIRTGAGRCSISGEFDCAKHKDLQDYLEEQGLRENDSLIIRREIDAGGKSRAFVNDRPVSLATLAAIGEYLVDVHGQHEHQSIIRSAIQRRLLDRFGNLEKLRGEVSGLYHLWRQLIAQKQSCQMSEQERQRLIDLYHFQVTEIVKAKLLAGEEEEIERILPQLKNAEKLRALSDEAYQILYGAEDATLGRLGKVQRILESITSLGVTLPESCENLKTACYQLEEVSQEIEDFRDNLKADPGKLDELLDRQDMILRLKRKYGATIADILAYRDKTAADLAVFLQADKNRQEFDAKIDQQFQFLSESCHKLTEQRKKAGKKLSLEVEKEIADLGMKKARFAVALEKENEPTSEGMERIDFMFSANAGEEMKPLKDIASGGEMSRVMLALKTVLAKADDVPVMVFDEVDAGIGGPMGQVVGKKLGSLAKYRQILCITHLPQIAAFACHHMNVAKSHKAGRTFTNVISLTDQERLEEIARMLSGAEITPSARKNAQELIDSSLKLS
jgi:DNA repair protein RecN (Recombination protein N)